MTTMTVCQLERYLAENHPRKISFMSENQKWFTVGDPMTINFNFKIIMTMSNPDIVFLKDDHGNTMSLDKVKYIHVDSEKYAIGTVIEVVCGDLTSSTNDISYVLVAS